MIPEKDIWRAATIMIRRYGDKALEERATRADQLEAKGDPEGRRDLALDRSSNQGAHKPHTIWAGASLMESVKVSLN
jgi:hypothetical protein